MRKCHLIFLELLEDFGQEPVVEGVTYSQPFALALVDTDNKAVETFPYFICHGLLCLSGER